MKRLIEVWELVGLQITMEHFFDVWIMCGQEECCKVLESFTINARRTRGWKKNGNGLTGGLRRDGRL